MTAGPVRLVVEIVCPPPGQEEAWRRRQAAGLRRFLEAVQENRRLAGLIPTGDSLLPEMAAGQGGGERQ